MTPRVMVIRPGPDFATQDVATGWVNGLREVGCEVLDLPLGKFLAYFQDQQLPVDECASRASLAILAATYEFWPDVALFISGLFVPPRVYAMLRTRGHRVVIAHTESPYEDARQLEMAPWADVNILNDPTSLDTFRQVNRSTHYIGHAYDPQIHRPMPRQPDLVSDFCFVGSGFPSRVRFLEAVDWTGIDVALAGWWEDLTSDSVLRKFLAHDITECCPNDETVALYCSAKASANLYRTEAEPGMEGAGWALGPREVELAACGTFFLTQARGENREVLAMVPTFDGPDDFGDKLRWFLAHDTEREAIADAARAAIAPRTFAANAAALLRIVEAL
jgi:spore maturation protein CgeB